MSWGGLLLLLITAIWKPLHFLLFVFSFYQENRGENGGQGAAGPTGVGGEPQRPRLASVPSRAEDAVDQLQENEKLIAGEV